MREKSESLFHLDDEQAMIVANVRRFVEEEIRPLEAELDPDADELPERFRGRLRLKVEEMGLFGWDIPSEFGGPGLSLVTQTLMAIEMAQHRAGLYAPCYGTFGGAGLSQLFEANEYQRERYLVPVLRGEKLAFFGLTEPSGGSDPGRAIRTSAILQDGAWVLNGTKTFISRADRADFGLVFARTGGEGRAGITCFIVDTDTPGFAIRRLIHTLRSAHCPTEIELVDVRVPPENMLGELNGGFRIASDRVARRRIPYAANCIGVAILAQKMAIEYAGQRETFGDLLATRQAIQWMLVDNEIDIRTARWLTLEAAAKADTGHSFRAEAAIAKLVATEGASRVVDRVMQIHGGYGMTKDLPLERWYRELRIRRIGEGPSEIQRLIIARELLGRSLR